MKGYTIIEQIGKGRFAKVHKATKGKEEEIYALKEIEKNDEIEKYLPTELDIAEKKLKHRNIVQIFEHFRDGSIYIVMEYCEMGDLSSYFVQVKPDINQRIVFMTHMALGVNYLHNQNIIHRDLKPENALITNKTGEIVCKITDFGVSRIKEKKQDVIQTYVGSLPYMAPEITGDQEYGKEVDIFALGMLFYAVYKYTILTTSFGIQSLIAGLYVDGNRIAYLNEVMKRKKPTLEQFIEEYFQDSNVVVGKFIFSMVNIKPENRPQMDFVLMKISAINVQHELNPTIKKQEQSIKDLQDRNEALRNELHDTKEKLVQTNKLVKSWNSEKQHMTITGDLQKQNKNLTEELLKLHERIEVQHTELKQQTQEQERINLKTQLERKSMQENLKQVESTVGRLTNQIVEQTANMEEKHEKLEKPLPQKTEAHKEDTSVHENRIAELGNVIEDVQKPKPKDAGTRTHSGTDWMRLKTTNPAGMKTAQQLDQSGDSSLVKQAVRRGKSSKEQVKRITLKCNHCNQRQIINRTG